MKSPIISSISKILNYHLIFQDKIKHKRLKSKDKPVCIISIIYSKFFSLESYLK